MTKKPKHQDEEIINFARIPGGCLCYVMIWLRRTSIPSLGVDKLYCYGRKCSHIMLVEAEKT